MSRKPFSDLTPEKQAKRRKKEARLLRKEIAKIRAKQQRKRGESAA